MIFDISIEQYILPFAAGAILAIIVVMGVLSWRAQGD